MESQTDIFPATTKQLHFAVCPGAGMGHVAPFLSLASSLSSAPYNCHVTVLIIVPLVTAAESDQISSFFSSHTHIHRLNFHVDLTSPTANVDPFFSRYTAISRSAHQLATRLSSLSPPISAAFTDFILTNGFNTTLPKLSDPFPNYTVITTSSRFFSLMAYLPCFVKSLPSPGQPVEIPGLDPFPPENIPPPFFNPDHIFTNLIVSNSRYTPLSRGLLINTFDSFEPETLSAFKTDSALPNLPPIFPIGPLHGLEDNNENDEYLCWLDEQPENSVIYVSFGNRTAMSRDQIIELGMGLEMSGYRFLWVVKATMVDKEEKEEITSLLGEELHEKLSMKGKVVRQWVNQKEILGHKAVGGFVSHCGWNSVMEAALCGVPVLAWPQHGDQRENAGVVEKAGLGVWERRWGWGIGGGKVVGAAEVAEKVEIVMKMKDLRRNSIRVGEVAKMACQVDGSSSNALMSIVRSSQ